MKKFGANVAKNRSNRNRYGRRRMIIALLAANTSIHYELNERNAINLHGTTGYCMLEKYLSI